MVDVVNRWEVTANPISHHSLRKGANSSFTLPTIRVHMWRVSNVSFHASKGKAGQVFPSGSPRPPVVASIIGPPHRAPSGWLAAWRWVRLLHVCVTEIPAGCQTLDESFERRPLPLPGIRV